MSIETDLRAAFIVDPIQGKVYWRISPRYGILPGAEAGCLDTSGYWRIRFRRKGYLRSRLIWFLVKGNWPVNELDHDNRNPIDDRLVNLIDASHSENMMNRGLNRNNKTGVTGVYIHRENGTFIAQKRGKYLGSFLTIAAAQVVYERAP